MTWVFLLKRKELREQSSSSKELLSHTWVHQLLEILTNVRKYSFHSESHQQCVSASCFLTSCQLQANWFPLKMKIFKKHHKLVLFVKVNAVGAV